MNDTAYERITEKILELLDKGTVPWHRPWKGCRNLVSDKEYRGINPFVLGCQPFGSPYWLTFKQAKEKGGHVRKGEKAAPVVFWKVYETDPETGETEKRFVLRYYSVFNVEQCEGIEIPAIETQDHKPIQTCEQVVSAMPQRPDIRHESRGAFYRPSEDFVSLSVIQAFDGPEEYYSTLFHELTHSTGHESRLNRHKQKGYTSHRFGSADYSREELVAEMGAAFLCGHCHIENHTIDNSASYIHSWRSRLGQDPRLIVTAAAKAQKASDFILRREYKEGE